MKFDVIILMALALMVSACATTGKYEEKLQSWVGNDVNSLITSWGPPSQTYTMPNGTKTYTYVEVGSSRAIASQNSLTGQYEATSFTFYCQTTFATDSSDHITSWQWKGNACRSR